MDMWRAKTVEAALEDLMAALDAEMAAANRRGAAAFAQGDYAEARKVLQISEWLKEYRSRVESLREEWERRLVQEYRKKSKRGGLTPQRAFVLPILRVLTEMGGSGYVAHVLTRVGMVMEDILTERDREPVPSDPRTTRWKNAARWARLKMVKDGPLSDESPYGIWEITEMGRRYLEQQSRDSIA